MYAGPRQSVSTLLSHSTSHQAVLIVTFWHDSNLAVFLSQRLCPLLTSCESSIHVASHPFRARAYRPFHAKLR